MPHKNNQQQHDRVQQVDFDIFQKLLTVVSYSLNINQAYDRELGDAQGMVYGGTLNLVIKNAREPRIVSWMLSPNEKQSGSLILKNGNRRLSSIDFENGYLVNYGQSWSVDGDVLETLSISAKKLDIEGVTHNR